MRFDRTLVATLLGVALALAGCAGAKSGSARSGACSTLDCSQNGVNAGTGGSNAGGTSSPGAAGTGTIAGSGAIAGRTGGAGATGGAPAVDAGSAARDAGSMRDARVPVAQYMLVVDTPANGASVSGSVTVRGVGPGFKNVEAWDATHQKPPLGQGTPGADGAFSFTVDTSGLPAGATTWTIHAWDSTPGMASMHDASAQLALTIGTMTTTPPPDAGGTMMPAMPGGQTIGTGDMSSPALGPPPSEAGKIGGASFVLVKNWDFGTNGTIPDIATLNSEFQYHDQFGTIGNGTNYGALIVAPNSATAISGQPVEDPARPYREMSADSLKTYVRPLSASQTDATVSKHDAGCGSVVAKWTLPSGGALLGKDLLWETRARMPVSAAAYWFAIWTAGNKWNKGAEMDVLESFGTPNIYPPPAAFHVNSVGGSDHINYSSWPSGLTSAGVPSDARDLREWHTWSWLYRTDDTYTVYYDGYVVQTGTLHWTLGGTTSGEHIDMFFLIDLGWGHTQIQDVNISLPASSFPIGYELDYSRVYLR